MEPAPISPDELPDLVAAVRAAFHQDVKPARLESYRRRIEPERTLVLRDGGRIVAVTAIYSRRLAVPGRVVPMAGVTQVGVLPTHRRRGLLTALMRRQLADVYEAGREAVAALWASESAIYGRFGYGVASEAAELEVIRERARLRAAPTVALMPAADAVEAMRAIHEAVWPDQPGTIDRDGVWWDVRIEDPEDERDGAQALQAAVVEGAGYALYAVTPRWADGVAAGEVTVREVMAVTPEGRAAIWGYLVGLDLTRRLVYDLAPRDEPLVHMLADARAARMRVGDGLWVRLVDLPRALAERAYAAPFEVVLEVFDEFCPWNAGRWALRWDGHAASCESTSLPAGLAVSAAELGAAHLGGTTLDVLARAGRVQELRAGALAAASRAFGWHRAPWCPEIF